MSQYKSKDLRVNYHIHETSNQNTTLMDRNLCTNMSNLSVSTTRTNDEQLVSEIQRISKVVRIQRKNGKIVQDCDVYIGRACYMGGWRLPKSKWHNPFALKEYSREEALKKYREYLYDSGLIKDIEELRGKTLGCWCKPLKCHGDILLEELDLCERNT